MIIYRSILTAENRINKTAVALGAFDGIHLGHKRVIESVLSTAYEPSVFTFSDNPSLDLSGKAEYLITDFDKENILDGFGIANLYSVPFSQVKNLEPEEFFRTVLVDKLNAGLISCGKDFRFGEFARGNTELLEKLCREEGIELRIVPDVMLNGNRVSSSLIRECVKSGNIAEAEAMLGRPFYFTIPVTKGNQLGRTLGIPTINQILPEHFVLPRFGVYAAVVTVYGKRYPGTCNIGVKPSIKGSYRPSAETWIGGDFSADIYGEEIRTEIYDFIRPEKKFESLDALKEEIKKNAVSAEKICRDKI